MSSPLSVLIVGNAGGTNIGDSLHRAAKGLQYRSFFFNAYHAFAAPRWVTRLSWHILGHRPPRLAQANSEIVKLCQKERPDVVIATGAAPLTVRGLQTLQKSSTTTAVFLTDDPWNPTAKAEWFLTALPYYDLVFTPRTATLEDLTRLGCRNVHYLPFGYDSDLFYKGEAEPNDHVAFVGGADTERVQFLTPLTLAELPLALYGDYWERYRVTSPYAKGHIGPDLLRQITTSAFINLCLVRRANRDGHVMRSFEIPACGGCLVAEDSADHREFFGVDGESVLYFSNASDIKAQCQWLYAHPAARGAMVQQLHQRIIENRHTYQDRLLTILSHCSVKA